MKAKVLFAVGLALAAPFSCMACDIVEALIFGQAKLVEPSANAEQVKRAHERMAADLKSFSKEELDEIESLYQVANKEWDTPKGKRSLKLLVSKYQKSNRTGCAVLYLGQMSKSAKRIEYFQSAIKEYSDCCYGDGVQVGAFARFMLAAEYLNSGRKAQAQPLLDELKAQYPDAINHKGEALQSLVSKESWWKQFD